MAGLSTFDVGECCCGDGSVFCGTPCAVCGGVHLDGTGTVTDANGTHALNNFQTDILWTTVSGLFSSFCGDPNASVCQAELQSGSVPYRITVVCSGSQISGLYSSYPALVPIACDDTSPPPGTPAYYVLNDWGGGCGNDLGGIPYLFYPAQLSTPTSCEGSVQGTITFPNPISMFEFGYPLAPLIPSFDYVLNYEVPKAQVCCQPCPIPKKDLTVHWNNTLTGMGQTPLIYSPPGHWNSACSNQLLYALSCPAGSNQFSVTYFLTGDCPRGQQQSCTSPGRNPFSLVLDRFTCSPFMLHYRCTVASCVVLGDNGYTEFWITDP